jgi:hypothetical protein
LLTQNFNIWTPRGDFISIGLNIYTNEDCLLEQALQTINNYFYYNLPFCKPGDTKTVKLFIKNIGTESDNLVYNCLLQKETDSEQFITYSLDNIIYSNIIDLGDFDPEEIKYFYVKQNISDLATDDLNPRTVIFKLSYVLT